MKIISVHETPSGRNSEAVGQVFRGRTVADCGVAQFPPGLYAHEGERHVHEHDEVFIVLAGQLQVPIGPARPDASTPVARAGDWILVQAGEEHHLTNHTHLPAVAMFLILK